MRTLFVLLASIAALPSPGAGQVVILGDSLSKEYEFSFRFDGFGDPDSVRNWIEILDEERPEFFDTGSRLDLSLLFIDIFFRHRYNWAVPGAKMPQLSAFLRGELEFVEFFTGSDPTTFEQVINAIAGLIDDGDFAVAELDDQIRHSAERIVLLAGGNDADEVYRELYEADPSFDAAAWVDEFLAEAAFIMDWVLERNPGIEFVVVALPHVGITPKVKASHPTDSVKTARVTTVMRQLNQGLQALAQERKIAFADIFEPMLRLLDSGPLCIHGVPFHNDIPPSGSDPGSLNYVWLNGTASDGFHPNTNGQIVVANEIIRAFNEFYGSGIAPLTATEMLQDWLGKDPEVSFASWLDCYGLAGAGAQDDRDHDRLPAALEFGVGGDPLRYDPWQVEISPGRENGAAYLELAYFVRLPGTSHVTLENESSTDLSEWNPLPADPGPAPDGRQRARIPLEGSRGFLRLRATIP